MRDCTGNIEFTIIEESADRAVSEMPVRGGILNPFGTVHAGATLWFADVTATALVLQGREASAGMEGFPLAINLSAGLAGNQSDGTLRAESTWVKRGRTLSVVRTTVTGRDGRLIADVTTTHLASQAGAKKS